MLPDLVLGQRFSTILSGKCNLDNDKVLGCWRDAITTVSISDLDNKLVQKNDGLETGVPLRY